MCHDLFDTCCKLVFILHVTSTENYGFFMRFMTGQNIQTVVDLQKNPQKYHCFVLELKENTTQSLFELLWFSWV